MHTITFYSYKGGTGRTLTVANTARFLAHFKRKVFVLDLDLEAPGLHYKFGLRNEGERELPIRGLVDFVHHFTSTGSVPELPPYVRSVPEFNLIHLMPAGNAPSPEYSKQLAEIRLPELFNPTQPAGSNRSMPIAVPLFLELKKLIEKEYSPDYLLIDSRTGVTEIGGVAVRLMPDTLVCLVHKNAESLAGARRVLRNVHAASRPDRDKPIDIFVALARIPEMPYEEEKDILEKVKDYFNEPSDKGRETLSLSEVLTLHSDPDLQVVEALRIGANVTANESILLRDYFKLFRVLGLDKDAPAGAREVLKALAEADTNERIRPLLVAGRRLRGESSVSPISMTERLRNKQTFKVVRPAYLTGGFYGKFIDRVQKYLTTPMIGNRYAVDSLKDEEVRWDLLAVHLREGVLDFCADIYYLTENRSYLVEVVQLGWCETFQVCMGAGPMLGRLKKNINSTDLDQLRNVLKEGRQYKIAVLGDTPAASETNRRLSPWLKTDQLVSKGSEEELHAWLTQQKDHGMAACDHVVAAKLKDYSDYSSLECEYNSRIPVGIVYPREDRQWRKELSKAIASSLLEFLKKNSWDKFKGGSGSIAEDFSKSGIKALSLSDLKSSLLLDLPFEDAVRWNEKIKAVEDRNPSRS